MEDKVCPHTESIRNLCVPYKFFKITEIVEGEKYSSNGRLGIDYNQHTDEKYPSYLSALY